MYLRKLATENLAENFDFAEDISFCECCSLAKSSKKPVFNYRKHDAKYAGEIIHSDIKGPFKIQTRNHEKYYVSFIDNFSRYTRIYLIKNKSNAFNAFINFHKWITTLTDKSVKELRTDEGG